MSGVIGTDVGTAATIDQVEAEPANDQPPMHRKNAMCVNQPSRRLSPLLSDASRSARPARTRTPPLSCARAHFKPRLASRRNMRACAQASAVLDIEDTPCIGTSMSPGLAPTPGAAPTPDVNSGYSTFRLDVEEQTVLQQWRDAREEWKKSIASAARGLRT